MKIAIYFSGRITGYKDCINNLKIKFFNLYECDFFMSLDIEEEDNEIKEFISELYKFTKTIKVHCEKYTKFLKNIPFKSDETRERNSLSMFYHNYKATDMILSYIKDTDIIYDAIVKFRIEVDSNDPFVINHNIQHNTVYIPYGYCYRGINDQIAYGNIQTMTKYASVYHYIQNYVYIRKVIFNPELLLMYHLNDNNMNIIRFPYNYILNKSRHIQSSSSISIFEQSSIE
jgi:hypothetical protein